MRDSFEWGKPIWVDGNGARLVGVAEGYGATRYYFIYDGEDHELITDEKPKMRVVDKNNRTGHRLWDIKELWEYKQSGIDWWDVIEVWNEEGETPARARFLAHCESVEDIEGNEHDGCFAIIEGEYEVCSEPFIYYRKVKE